MFELFYMGGPLFMGILTLLFLIVLTQAVRSRLKYSRGDWDTITTRRNLSYIRSVGVLAFVIGVFGQLIGLYSAFAAMEQMEGISPTVLAQGLKVSMITTIYGSMILVISLLIWLILDSMLKASKV
jgi:biopolymer transport protein ExbB/TolQ